MEQGRLLEVRCPAMVWDKKNDKSIKCKKLCVKVYPGSSGECSCRSCKARFQFYVDSQARSILSVRAKPIEEDKS